LNHAIFKALLFLAAGSVIHSIGTRDLRRMGGLSGKMPFVRNVFIVGALALAGVPILNGFWSKELILEISLEHSPLWMHVSMLAGVGFTAFYTFRMVWLVFFGEERDFLPYHPAGTAIKFPLGVLAVGTFTTWLFFGGLSELFSTTLPYSGIEYESTVDLVISILTAPATWLTLGIVALGFAISWVRARGYRLFGGGWLTPLVETSLGFDSLNGWIVQRVNQWSEDLRTTQTGQLNWNILGIFSGMLVVLFILWLGVK
jgi:NADH-quinone oxidoreductase subunit L